jgi:hypothetical protein
MYINIERTHSTASKYRSKNLNNDKKSGDGSQRLHRRCKKKDRKNLYRRVSFVICIVHECRQWQVYEVR